MSKLYISLWYISDNKLTTFCCETGNGQVVCFLFPNKARGGLVCGLLTVRTKYGRGGTLAIWSCQLLLPYQYNYFWLHLVKTINSIHATQSNELTGYLVLVAAIKVWIDNIQAEWSRWQQWWGRKYFRTKSCVRPSALYWEGEVDDLSWRWRHLTQFSMITPSNFPDSLHYQLQVVEC